MLGHRIGYVRVSSLDQNPQRQLEDVILDKVFIDHASGRDARRPQLEAMWGGTPWRYRWKLWRLAARHRDWLQGQGAELWVSTPHLAAKYAAWGAQLIWPSAVAGAADGTIFFYHGTASHVTHLTPSVIPGKMGFGAFFLV